MWFSKKMQHFFLKLHKKLFYTSYFCLRNHCSSPPSPSKIKNNLLETPSPPLDDYILCGRPLNVKKKVYEDFTAPYNIRLSHIFYLAVVWPKDVIYKFILDSNKNSNFGATLNFFKYCESIKYWKVLFLSEKQ